MRKFTVWIKFESISYWQKIKMEVAYCYGKEYAYVLIINGFLEETIQRTWNYTSPLRRDNLIIGLPRGVDKNTKRYQRYTDPGNWKKSQELKRFQVWRNVELWLEVHIYRDAEEAGLKGVSLTRCVIHQCQIKCPWTTNETGSTRVGETEKHKSSKSEEM